MGVLDDQDDRVRAEALDHRQERHEQLRAADVRIARDGRRRAEQGRVEETAQRSRLRADDLRRRRTERVEVTGESIEQRLQRQIASQRIAPAVDDHGGRAERTDPCRHQRRLADARFAAECHRQRASRCCALEATIEPHQLGLAAGDRRRRAGRWARIGEITFADDELVVDALGLRRGVDTEILRQPRADAHIGGESRGRPAGGGVGAHQQSQRGLVVRVTAQ